MSWHGRRIRYKTRFAGSVSSRRIVEGVGFEMAKVQRVRKWVSGVTTNDVFLATVGGAVRRYLQESGDPLWAAWRRQCRRRTRTSSLAAIRATS